MPSLVPITLPHRGPPARAARPIAAPALAVVVALAALPAAGRAQAVEPLPSATLIRAAREADSLRRVVVDRDAQIVRLSRDKRDLAAAVRDQRAALDAQRLRADSLDRRVAAADSLRAIAAAAPTPAPASGPPAATPAPVVSAAPAPVVTQQAAPEAAAKPVAPAAAPKAIEIGVGRITFGGLLQGWAAAGDAGYRNTFRVRRAELKFIGELSPKARWTVVADLAKSLAVSTSSATVNGTKVLTDASVSQGSRVLQDAYVTLGLPARLQLDIGAQKLPLSLEGLQSSSGLEIVERAMFASDRARGGSYGDIRDVGAALRGTFARRVDVQVGAYNGSGESQNDVDRNAGKAYGARVVMRPPLLTGLQLGASGVWGGTPRGDTPRRDRLGAELLYRRGPLHLKSELMTGKDGALARRGFYAHAGYRLPRRAELVARFDSWDPNVSREATAADATARDYLVGGSLPLAGGFAKVQLNYLRRTYSNAVVPARHLVLANIQTNW